MIRRANVGTNPGRSVGGARAATDGRVRFQNKTESPARESVSRAGRPFGPEPTRPRHTHSTLHHPVEVTRKQAQACELIM